ncbi:MAG: GGDEF domain-containing protein, partial [Oscillospiraceae bacterium]|nr:GGDEF domain-containing protein [Oscillospiraceae bacterium]
LIRLYYSTVDDMIFTHFLISNITKDMTVYGSDESKCFFSIVNNLYRVHMDSSYIYTYEAPLIHTAKTEWEVPDMVNLQAYHDGDKLAAVTGEARRIHINDILCNEYTPKDRRRTMIISPLFVNEEQYGVIVCELENEYFPYIYSITPQICTAIKLTNLVTQLEESLDVAQTRNNLLNRISMSDELTGIYNRRGFYAGANRILKAPENQGRRSVLIFGDLDNLKTINDTFGHDDGDYAIVTAANYLKSGLRADDVVARIGGDEFAAYAICDDAEIMHSLPSRIKKIAAAHNEKSDKPYNVTMSIGICEIVCSPDLNIQQFMDKADAALYSDKKNKNRNILKEPKN